MAGMLSGNIGSLMDEVTAGYEGMRQRAIGGVSGLTDGLMEGLRAIGPEIATNYKQAQEGQAAVDARLTELLAGRGGAEMSSLSNALRQIGIGGEGQQELLGNTGGIGRQAGIQTAGSGASTMSRLIGEGAAFKSWADTLPAAAAAASQGYAADISGQIDSALAQAMSQIARENAGRESDTFMRLRESEIDRAIAKEGFRNQDRQFGLQTAQLGEDQRQFDANASMQRDQMSQQQAQWEASFNQTERFHQQELDAQAAGNRQAAQKARQDKLESATSSVRDMAMQYVLQYGVEEQMTLPPGMDQATASALQAAGQNPYISVKVPRDIAALRREVTAIIAPRMRAIGISPANIQAMINEALSFATQQVMSDTSLGFTPPSGGVMGLASGIPGPNSPTGVFPGAYTDPFGG